MSTVYLVIEVFVGGVVFVCLLSMYTATHLIKKSYKYKNHFLNNEESVGMIVQNVQKHEGSVAIIIFRMAPDI